MARPPARSTQRNNPHATFKLFCTSVRTKEHAQLVGIISLSVFVCLIVVSYSLFGVFAVAYIASGILIYGFLMESLLRKPNKIAILGYVTFEALQIAFYLSLAIYILIPLIYSSDFDWSCSNSTTTSPDNDQQTNSDCTSKASLIEVLVFLVFLIIMKSYFARVMLHLYKFFVWTEQHSSDLSASYVNNRGVQINVDESNIFPPPPLWTPGLYSTNITNLPSYDEATNMQKPPLADQTPRTEEQQNGQTDTNRST
ncbi:hypothetical protein M3Y97_00421600 [Aphelenchoides bicaudatus]|nr:hypothetical protein M3Y97_00421600 [Aphelenchoides bicaudatus]